MPDIAQVLKCLEVLFRASQSAAMTAQDHVNCQTAYAVVHNFIKPPAPEVAPISETPKTEAK